MTEKPGPASSQSSSRFSDDQSEQSSPWRSSNDPTVTLPGATGQPTTTGQGSTGGDPAPPEFPMVRRGYDKHAVDYFLATQQQAEVDAAKATRATQEELSQLRSRVKELELVVSEQQTPTYAGLGEHAAAMLRLAEEQAATVTATAYRSAEETRVSLTRDAAALKADAEKEASDIRTVQRQEIDERRATVLAEANEERSLAKAEASDVLAAAHREAEQVRLATQQKANDTLTAAKREAEQIRAVADREATEARRMLAVEKERMTKEASQRHATASSETARLVDQAEARSTAAEERARVAVATATKHREHATAEAEKSLARSRREAEEIITSARRQAEQIVANSASDLDRKTATARSELDVLTKRRDGIVAQLGQLRDLVSTFGGGGGVEQPRTGTPAQESVAAAAGKAGPVATTEGDESPSTRSPSTSPGTSLDKVAATPPGQGARPTTTTTNETAQSPSAGGVSTPPSDAETVRTPMPPSRADDEAAGRPQSG